MSGVVKKEYIEDDTDVVYIQSRQIKCELIEHNSHIQMQQETEEKKTKENPLRNVQSRISRHETMSAYIKKDLPQDSSENAIEAIVQNKTPETEEKKTKENSLRNVRSRISRHETVSAYIKKDLPQDSSENAIEAIVQNKTPETEGKNVKGDPVSNLHSRISRHETMSAYIKKDLPQDSSENAYEAIVQNKTPETEGKNVKGDPVSNLHSRISRHETMSAYIKKDLPQDSSENAYEAIVQNKTPETEGKNVKGDPVPNLHSRISRRETMSAYIKKDLPQDSSENANQGIVQNKTPETEGKNVKGDPLPNLHSRISRRETMSDYIKKDFPQDSSENAIEAIVQKKTPTIEECSSSSVPNAGELLSRESVKAKRFCKNKLQPSFPNNSQNSSQYEALLYSINRLTPFNAENGEYETPHNWKIVNWSSRQSDRLTHKKAIAEAKDNHKFAKLRQKFLKLLENESASHREIRLSKMRNREKIRRNAETTEQREERLIKLRQSQAQRLANETPEQKAHRLQQMRATAAHRIANETPEQRNVRLIKMRECAAKRLANESPEKREYRLKQLRLYRSRRIAKMQRLAFQNINVPALSSSASSEHEHEHDFSLPTSHQLCQSEITDTTGSSRHSKFRKSAKEGNVGRKSREPVSNSDEAQSVSD